MSDHTDDDRPATPDSSDLAGGDFDTALIPHEQDEDPKAMAANRAKAGSGSGEPGSTGDGDESTDPNAQPPA